MKEELKERLERRRKKSISDDDRVPSAVLIPLYKNEGDYHIVFIKRTETVKAHKGQISFPGGTREINDRTIRDTAIREANEEIGLLPEHAEILGELDDEITTTSNYIVTPFIAMIPWPYSFVINRGEVDEIIKVPVAALLEKDCLKPDVEFLNGKEVESYAYQYEGKVIWGATARILNKLLGIIGQIIEDKR
ncbi:MAG: CoA pyrophosphatase [Dehalococcoidales bacterium]|nr:CoA pyrophosphatase [Dehalococcoidales bacterium]